MQNALLFLSTVAATNKFLPSKALAAVTMVDLLRLAIRTATQQPEVHRNMVLLLEENMGFEVIPRMHATHHVVDRTVTVVAPNGNSLSANWNADSGYAEADDETQRYDHFGYDVRVNGRRFERDRSAEASCFGHCCIRLPNNERTPVLDVFRPPLPCPDPETYIEIRRTEFNKTRDGRQYKISVEERVCVRCPPRHYP